MARMGLLVLIGIAWGPSTWIARADSSAALTRQLDDYAGTASRLGFSGTLLVARGQEILINKGYGWADRAHLIRNDANTAYYIASLTKQFTAAAVLRLEADRLGRKEFAG